MGDGTNRREFIIGTITIGGMALIGCKTVGSSAVQNGTSAGPAMPAPRVRRRVTMAGGVTGTAKEAAKDLASYVKAVDSMKKTKAANGRSVWQNQAQIHQDWCPHGNWYFLPWHRAYLLHFEELCRKHSGDDDFALPYWDWTECPSIPDAFWEKGSPLVDARRVKKTTVFPEEAVGRKALDRILAANDFETFGSGRAKRQRDQAVGGMLEGIPHNRVHATIGANMGTFLSPLDPIFWLHHCNVDRIWAEWAAKNPSINLPGDPDSSQDAKLTQDFWLKATLDGYADLDGKPVTHAVQEMLDLAPLGFTYDTLVPAVGAPKGMRSPTPNAGAPGTGAESAPGDTREAAPGGSPEGGDQPPVPAPADAPAPMGTAYVPSSQGGGLALAGNQPRKKAILHPDDMAASVKNGLLHVAMPDARNVAKITVIRDLLRTFQNRQGSSHGARLIIEAEGVFIPTSPTAALRFYVYFGDVPATVGGGNRSPNYVASVSFFGHDHGATGGSHTVNLALDATDAVTAAIAGQANLAKPLYAVVEAVDFDPDTQAPQPIAIPANILRTNPVRVRIKVVQP